MRRSLISLAGLQLDQSALRHAALYFLGMIKETLRVGQAAGVWARVVEEQELRM